jgi:hypothetical protein
VAGEGAKADHVDTLDLFHTMEAYFTWYPNGVPEREPDGRVSIAARSASEERSEPEGSGTP